MAIAEITRQINLPHLAEKTIPAEYLAATGSMRGLLSEELQNKIALTTLGVAGCGSVGNPAAMAWLESGGFRTILADPQEIEVSNLTRQEYRDDQIGKNKALSTALNMRLTRPYCSRYLVTYPEGVTTGNVEEIVDSSDVLIDAIDVTALEVIWELHRVAAQNKKPVLVGYDLAGTPIVAVYRYDKKLIPPLGGAVRQADIDRFLRVKEAYLSRKLDQSAFLDYIYSLFTGPIPPLKVPVEQLQELISREHDGRISTPQLGTTARALSSLLIETIRQIVADVPVKSIIGADIPSLVRLHNPSALYKGSLLLRVLRLLKRREKRVNLVVKALDDEELTK